MISAQSKKLLPLIPQKLCLVALLLNIATIMPTSKLLLQH
jgi:hypothetical protein